MVFIRLKAKGNVHNHVFTVFELIELFPMRLLVNHSDTTTCSMLVLNIYVGGLGMLAAMQF